MKKILGLGWILACSVIVVNYAYAGDNDGPAFTYADLKEAHLNAHVRTRLQLMLRSPKELAKTHPHYLSYQAMISGVEIPPVDPRCGAAPWKTGFLEAVSGMKIDEVRMACEEKDPIIKACSVYRNWQIKSANTPDQAKGELELHCCLKAFTKGQGALLKKIVNGPAKIDNPSSNSCRKYFSEARSLARRICQENSKECYDVSAPEPGCRSLGYLTGRADFCPSEVALRESLLREGITANPIKNGDGFLVPDYSGEYGGNEAKPGK